VKHTPVFCSLVTHVLSLRGNLKHIHHTDYRYISNNLSFFFSVFVPGGHHQDAKVRVNIKVKDMNDNAPEFATQNEVLVCENVRPGKVSKLIVYT